MIILTPAIAAADVKLDGNAVIFNTNCLELTFTENIET